MNTSISTPSRTLPLQGGRNRTPSPFQGEGWDGGEILNNAENSDVSHAP